ncbi:hypothetical protein G8A07_20810 [Roseateles sp. DAIF2]|uniref:hypothetical protein n=1 Tax=Roseateles sp. DAIF2 TaxID=2714952 RepID=UPI0018A32706|nr:hypothetical protein [Roseateles sp. DAIF2]QPF75114.1 hypothetical protein G8A07_20810 [Roseateles sp. DAIF2]
MKSSSFPSLPHLLAALLLVAGAGQSALAADAAQDQLGRVEVHGQQRADLTPPRTDVRAVCPGADQDLQDSLAKAWYQHQQPGVVRVDFKLDGRQVSEVSTSGSARLHYGQAVRRAMYGLSCNTGSAGAQRFSALISFAEDDASHPRKDGQVVALSQP